MRKRFGIIFIIIGTALMTGALSLFIINRREDLHAQNSAQRLIPYIVQEIEQSQAQNDSMPNILDNTPPEYLTEEDLIMKEELIDGNWYIGYLSIPELGLELPVMSDWSYQQLKMSPCRFSGTIRGQDLVIMAHNYMSHFGRISELSEGAEVLFTDMDGNIWRYEVVVIDILDPYAVEDMIAGEYDLSLFSCSPGGSYRVTVRCDKIE